ncbi:hypothetical protein KR059_001469 [Drosophila kikkawai]|nr:hypothetical protein KR059_001469 [Drosophila kikkawai]
MENKPAVTALKEFCSKSSKNTPIYDFIIGREGGYICKVKALEMESHGNGRTKREAKQLAAENLWRKLSVQPGVSTEIQILNRDMLKELRDYCLLHGMPQPIIKAVQQSDSSSAQDFVASCSVGSIKCYAKADKKKYARQLAASEVLAMISNQMPDANVEMTRDFGDTMLETKKCFNAFKELTDTGSVDIKAVRLCDRHNYFKRFCPALKEAAFEVIRSDEYANTKDKALSLMSALKLTPSIGTVDSTSEEPLLKVDLNCEFDCLFLGMESKIYGQIIQYFKDMLV